MRQEVEAGLNYAKKRGVVNLIWIPGGAIRIVQDQYGHSFHLTETFSLFEKKLGEVRALTSDIEGKLAPELPLFKPRANLQDVLDEIPTFLRDTFPEIEDMPIFVFRSERDFRERKPIASYPFPIVSR